MADRSTGERIARLEGGLNGMQEQMLMLGEQMRMLGEQVEKLDRRLDGNTWRLIGAIGGSTALIASLMVALKYLETTQ